MKPSLFAPLTLGFDWEVWIVDRAGMALPERKLLPILERVVRRHPRLPTAPPAHEIERGGHSKKKSGLISPLRVQPRLKNTPGGRKRATPFS